MFQLTELLLCQSNNMCHHSSLVQLIQLMSYNCREWRPDPRVGGAAVQMIYIPFHTQSTTYRDTLTEENLPAMTWLYCEHSSPTVWSSLSDRAVPTKAQEAQATPLGQVALIFPKSLPTSPPLWQCSSPLHRGGLTTTPQSAFLIHFPHLKLSRKMKLMAPGLLKCLLCHISRHPLNTFQFKALDCKVKNRSCLSNKDYIALLTTESKCI